MRPRHLLVLLCFSALVAGCGPKDPLAQVRSDFPGAREYLVWKTPSPPLETYLLIRWKPDNLAGVQKALLLRRRGAEYDTVGESELGFQELQEVSNVMPRPPDESTVEAFGLK